MIESRFDFVNDITRTDRDNCGFARFPLGVVPGVGEIVNIKGEPFYVLEVSRAIDDDGGEYAYIRVIHRELKKYPDFRATIEQKVGGGEDE